jgi:Tol biopolymer transport system component
MRLAISLTQYAGHSPYPGLHIIDTATGQDRHISEWTTALSYGCDPIDQMAWSPDGSHIAYVCEVRRHGYTSSQIRIMNADGTHPRLLSTGTTGSAWPSWSPDGTRIAFSTGRSPHEHLQDVAAPLPERFTRSAVYSVGLNGDHRRLLATDGAAPSWSPDGSAIAYRSACGRVRLAAPDGRDITPRGTVSNCVGMGPRGWPAWAPDGSLLAIATTHGIYLIRPDGSHVRRINPLSTRQRCCPAPAMTEAQIGGFVRPGVDRLAWRPVPGKPKR